MSDRRPASRVLEFVGGDSLLMKDLMPALPQPFWVAGRGRARTRTTKSGAFSLSWMSSHRSFCCAAHFLVQLHRSESLMMLSLVLYTMMCLSGALRAGDVRGQVPPAPAIFLVLASFVQCIVYSYSIYPAEAGALCARGSREKTR